ncbi:MAG: hypothetical protein KatS3mg076_0503 [Candidatus Binatia bacterium]|nr:MAG: hypothetical protein KatS3mg076_0503 [Candidatus Binatia bacterium]
MQRVADPRFRLVLLLLAALGAALGLRAEPWSRDFLACWALAFATFGALLATDPGPELPGKENPPLPGEWLLAALVLASGVFFRVFRLDLIPSGLNHDAAWNGLYALRILRGEPYTPYVAEAWGRETLMHYIQAAFLYFTGPSLWGVVFAAVFVGVVLLPFEYLWLREMFGTRAALVGTFLLGTSGWHIVLSRVGWRAITLPTVAAMACFFFWHALERRKLASYALAGAAVAGTVYTYNAGRIFPPFFALFCLFLLARKKTRRTHGRGLAVLGVAFALFVFPMAHYAATHWIQWQGRAVAAFHERKGLFENLRAALLLYGYSGNGDDFFVEEPLLEAPAAAALAFGLLWSLRRLRDPRASFLLLGLFLCHVPGVLSRPNGNRAIGTLPFVYAFCALGVAYFEKEIRRAFPRLRPLAPALVLSFLALSAAATYEQYFGPRRRDIFGFYPETTSLGLYMKSILPRYTVWVGGANFPRDTLTFLTYSGEGHPEERRYRWVDDVTALPRMELLPEPGKGVAVILPTTGPGALAFEELRERFPEHEVEELRCAALGDRVFAKALLVPREAVEKQILPPAALEKRGDRPPVLLAAATRGSGWGQFLDPKNVAVGPNGELYVADTGNHRVQKFSPDLLLERVWGKQGAADGRFHEPNALAVDSRGLVHVVDTWNQRVQVFDSEGRFLRAYKRPRGFFGPRGIAIAQGRVYVTDGGNSLVVVFDEEGKFVFEFGGKGSEPGKLLQPVGIAVTPSEKIWVVDSSNNRVQIFDRHGKPLAAIPVPGWQGDALKEAYLAAAGDDAVFLTDPVGRRLLRIEENGSVEVVRSDLEGPAGVAVRGDECFVTQRGPARVVRFRCREKA